MARDPLKMSQIRQRLQDFLPTNYAVVLSLVKGLSLTNAAVAIAQLLKDHANHHVIHTPSGSTYAPPPAAAGSSTGYCSKPSAPTRTHSRH